jgi:hypothetical protein
MLPIARLDDQMTSSLDRNLKKSLLTLISLLGVPGVEG